MQSSILAVLFLSTVIIQSQGKKNVLLFIVDDLRPFLGIYGDTKARTPNIDSLGARATVFEKAYVQQSVCAPSRTSMMTSRRPDTTRVYDFQTNFRDVNKGMRTLPEYFKKNGYISKGIGKIFQRGKPSGDNDDKNSWSSKPWRPTYHGGQSRCRVNGKKVFLMFCPVENDQDKHPDSGIRRTAIELIKKRAHPKRTKPFFIAVGFHRPHKPYKIPAKYLDLYPADTIEALDTATGSFPLGAPHIAHAPLKFGQHEDLKPYEGDSDLTHHFNETIQRKIQQYYRASVSFTDHNVGMVLKALKDKGFASNTVIALTADHGWQIGEHFQYGKHTNFEDAVRVPWIFLNPDETGQNLENFQYQDPMTQTAPTTKSPNLWVKTPVEMLDLFPTIVEAAGLPSIGPCPKRSTNVNLCTQGESRVGVNPDDPNAYAISQYPRPALEPTDNSRVPNYPDIKYMGYTIRTPTLRFTWWLRFRNHAYEANWDTKDALEELYDYTIDPHGNVNRASNPQYDLLKCQLKGKIIRKISPKGKCGKCGFMNC